jgi:hypothetical protein
MGGVEGAWLEKNFAGFHFSHFAQRTNAIDLFRCENRKSLTTNIGEQRS